MLTPARETCRPSWALYIHSTSPWIRGEAHWDRPRLGFTASLGLIGLSAGGRLKARRKNANYGLTPPLMNEYLQDTLYYLLFTDLNTVSYKSLLTMKVSLKNLQTEV